MPNPLIAKYAAKARCSEKHVEEVWARAREIADQRIQDRKSPKYWAYVNGIVKKELRLSEAMSFSEFITISENVGEDSREDQG